MSSSGSAVDLDRRIVLGDRYTLVRQIATGGMAEIFLARQKSLSGFEKDVVIKLLKDRYRSDKRVVDMFMNEAHIGAVLNHPNIVHVYDVGEHEGTPYIAMELIHGEELSQLCRRGLELASFLPLEHAVDLMRQAAEGMGYFHAKRDDQGGNLAIVHRDISPSNLLVTQDGVLKIIDYGIAKAEFPTGKRDPEEEKLIPGKYNYMSPEQVRGERVDLRSDVFSLGIVLYEITVGKRLFKGRPEEVMQKVTRGRIKPPTFIRRQYPAQLEAIVMRSLEMHRDDRYANAYELAGDLEQFLRETQLRSGPVRIARYLDDLRAAEGGERRQELVIAGEAWLDDDGEEALDFDRNFSVVSPLPVAPAPAPAATEIVGHTLDIATDQIEKVSKKDLEDDLTNIATQAAPPAPALKKLGVDEDATTVQETSIDDDLGEDLPTQDANLPLPAPLGALPETPATPKIPVVPPGPPVPPPTATVLAPSKDEKKRDEARKSGSRSAILPPPLDMPAVGAVPVSASSNDLAISSSISTSIEEPTAAARPSAVTSNAKKKAKARKEPLPPGRPIDLMLPSSTSPEAENGFGFGQGMIARRKSFPWLFVALGGLLLIVVIILIARG